MIPLYLLKKKSVVNYFDYILMLGQSNMDGRALLTGFSEKYRSSKPEFKKFTTSLGNYTAPVYGQWAWVFMHELSELYPDKQFNCIHVSYGGTYCHTGGAWNINGGNLFNATIEHIQGIKAYATSIGKVSRCTGILWDQKENDTGFPSYVQYTDDVLSGDFVNTISAIKAETGNDPWMIFAELMTYQTVSTQPAIASMIAMQRLYASHTPNAYLMPMNDNQQFVTSDDDVHYNADGCTYVGLMAKDILVNNNLII